MAKEKDQINTEKRILEAARRVFTTKGYAAARMDDIAKEAGINRALLHYYYRNKDRMFEIIFEEGFKNAFIGLNNVLLSKQELKPKINAIVEIYFDTISKHPDLPLFVISELATNPDRLAQILARTEIATLEVMAAFKNQVRKEVRKGTIKNIDGTQLLINVLALVIYPFIARPILKMVMQMDDASFDKMMAKRKKEITDFILDALKPE